MAGDRCQKTRETRKSGTGVRKSENRKPVSMFDYYEDTYGLSDFIDFRTSPYAARPICFKKATCEATAYRTRGYSIYAIPYSWHACLMILLMAG